MKRTFLAFEIKKNKKISEMYDLFFNSLREEKINWVRPVHFHATLFFLGNTRKDQISQIIDGLDKTFRHIQQFEILVKGCGVFPNLNKPSVIWLGIEQNTPLLQMKAEIQKTLISFGFPVEKRKFQPHLTIARIRKITRVDTLMNLTNSNQTEFLSKQLINKVVFFESRLTSDGPLYSKIKEFNLQ